MLDEVKHVVELPEMVLLLAKTLSGLMFGLVVGAVPYLFGYHERKVTKVTSSLRNAEQEKGKEIKKTV